jgi:hypothetical protein
VTTPTAAIDEPGVEVVEVLRGTTAGPVTVLAAGLGALAAAATVVLVATLLPRRTRDTGVPAVLWVVAAVATVLELGVLLLDGGAPTDRRPLAAIARLLLLVAGAALRSRPGASARLALGALLLLTVPLGLPTAGTAPALAIAVVATGVAVAVTAAVLAAVSARPAAVLAVGLGALAILAVAAFTTGGDERLPPYHLERVVAGDHAFDVTVAPVRPGTNELHLYVWDVDGRAAPLTTARAEVLGAPQTAHELFEVTPNHHLSYVLELPPGDVWDLALTGETPAGEELRATVRLEAP